MLYPAESNYQLDLTDGAAGDAVLFGGGGRWILGCGGFWIMRLWQVERLCASEIAGLGLGRKIMALSRRERWRAAAFHDLRQAFRSRKRWGFTGQ
jgi:hypothetical protein